MSSEKVNIEKAKEFYEKYKSSNTTNQNKDLYEFAVNYNRIYNLLTMEKWYVGLTWEIASEQKCSSCGLSDCEVRAKYCKHWYHKKCILDAGDNCLAVNCGCSFYYSRRNSTVEK